MMGVAITAVTLTTPFVAATATKPTPAKAPQTKPTQTKPDLSFNKNGEFRILQFTDIHLQPAKTDKTAGTLQRIAQLVDTYHPDLVVLTGDNVTDPPALKGWNQLIETLDALQTPYALTFGNHDGEIRSKSEIFQQLQKSPNFLGEPSPAGISGVGNHSLPLKGGDGKTAAVIYVIDSNEYPRDKRLGTYDWIHHDQIGWYRLESARHSARNDGRPLPALAFIHIPLPEYAQASKSPEFFGIRKEDECWPELNSGMFTSMVEMGDVMGVFAGHDHDNDYIGVHKGIALGYGRVSGRGSYGELEPGARLITLKEGKREFDTRIVTLSGAEPIFHFPAKGK